MLSSELRRNAIGIAGSSHQTDCFIRPTPKKKRRIRKRSAVRERLASLPNANNNALGRREDLCLQEAYLPWDLLGALSQDHICV